MNPEVTISNSNDCRHYGDPYRENFGESQPKNSQSRNHLDEFLRTLNNPLNFEEWSSDHFKARGNTDECIFIQT